MEETILSLEKQAMERWRHGDPWGFVEISAEDITVGLPPDMWVEAPAK